MGEKKKKEAAQKTWKKVLFVVAAVLFVVVMVVSSMGSNWISGIAPIKAGDQAVIDYTIYNAAGTPLVTSNQQIYQQQMAKGIGTLYAKQLSITANQSSRQAVLPVQVFIGDSTGGSWENFALYNPEFNSLSNAVVGMKTGDRKRVPFSFNATMSALFTPEDLAKSQVNMSSLSVGDSLAMGVSDNPNGSASNTSTSYIRLGEVTRISSSGVVVDFGYPYAEITVVSFTRK